jgi:hypothetical protein
MSYEVTIRNQWGEKIVKRAEVDDLNITLREILEADERQGSVNFRAEIFVRKYGKENLKYFWYTELIPAKTLSPDCLDMDNISLLFKQMVIDALSRDMEGTVAALMGYK